MGIRRSAIKSKRSKERRGRRTKTAVVFYVVVIAFLIGGVSWVAHNEKFLIRSIQIVGAQSVDTSAIVELAKEHIFGSYLWIFPKKNILIFPKDKLQFEILDKYKQIKNVVISRNGLRSIIITISEREPFALWCDGDAPVGGESTNIGKCYFVDNEGYIFSNAPYFHDHVYFELYGKLFLKTAEIAEGEEKGDRGVEKETAEANDEEGSAKEAEELSMETAREGGYIGTYFLPSAEFVRIMQFAGSLEKIDMPAYALIVTAPDSYELFLHSGGTLRFLPTQDFHRAIDNLATAYAKKFSDKSDASAEDLDYVDIRFNNKILFKFKN